MNRLLPELQCRDLGEDMALVCWCAGEQVCWCPGELMRRCADVLLYK